jgi:NADPH-dependent curcumin reductase CurA
MVGIRLPARLEDAPAAFEAMDSGDFFGKVVIRL